MFSRIFKISLLLLSAAIVLTSCKDEPVEPAYNNVMTLAINNVTDTTAFASARTAYLEVLTAKEGVVSERKFDMFFNYQTFGMVPPTAPIAIAMAEYGSEDLYEEVTNELSGTSEATDYFATVSPVISTVLTPLAEGIDPDLANICTEPGQILEIAVRDITGYTDMPDYEAKRDAFLELLSQQEGFVQEYQWLSTDGRYAVGMTVYRDVNAFFSISADTTFTQATATTAFGAYPAIAGGMHYQN